MHRPCWTWLTWYWDSDARLRRLPATKNQMRRCHDKYMALLGMCSIEATMYSPKCQLRHGLGPTGLVIRLQPGRTWCGGASYDGRLDDGTRTSTATTALSGWTHACSRSLGASASKQRPWWLWHFSLSRSRNPSGRTVRHGFGWCTRFTRRVTRSSATALGHLLQPT